MLQYDKDKCRFFSNIACYPKDAFYIAALLAKSAIKKTLLKIKRSSISTAKPIISAQLRHLPTYATKPIVNLTYQYYEHPTGQMDPEVEFQINRWTELVIAQLTAQRTTVDLDKQTLAWIKQHPIDTNPAWETYSASERIVNLCVWLSCLDDGNVLSDRQTYANFIAYSLMHIQENLELHGKRTNNHILNNARALIVGGTVINDQRSIEKGIALFEAWYPVIFQPTGFARERSGHYQLLFALWLLDCRHFLAQSANYAKATQQFNLWLTRVLPATKCFLNSKLELKSFIGDLSPDLTPRLTTKRLQALYAAELMHVKPALETSDWYFLQQEKQTVITNYPQTAYPLTYPTHGHSDFGSFEWLYDERPVLIDSGRGRYGNYSDSIRQISAIGHNTLLMHGFPPLSEPVVSRWRYIPKSYAATDLHVITHESNKLVVAHNGFRRIQRIKTYKRGIELSDQALIVTDEIDGRGECELMWLWHFDEHFTLTPEGEYIRFACEKISGKLSLKSNTDLFTKSFTIDTVSHAHSYAEFAEHPLLCISARVNLPITVISIFQIRE